MSKSTPSTSSYVGQPKPDDPLDAAGRDTKAAAGDSSAMGHAKNSSSVLGHDAAPSGAVSAGVKPGSVRVNGEAPPEGTKVCIIL